MVFCKVTPELADLIRQYAGERTIVDCGAGECSLQKALGEQVVSLDIMPYPDTSAVPIDARDFPMNSRMLPVFLRPCHSTWVHETVLKNLHKVESFLYIGLPKNLQTDLDCECSEYRVIAIHPEWTGEEGEKIWQIVPRDYHTDDTLLTFALASSSEWDDPPCWYEVPEDDEADYLINWAGGHVPKVCLNIQRLALANDFEALDWSGTILDDPSQNAGYLSRRGIFFGCPSQLHTVCARYRLKLSAQELESSGWVHIYGPPKHDEYRPNWVSTKTLSAEQRNWLVRRGYIVNDWD